MAVELGDTLRDPRDRKAFGIYYTPLSLARPLVKWALSERLGPLLDPSFGGCSFLEAALDQLEGHATEPGTLIFGVDIDRDTEPYRNNLLRRGVPPANLRFDDFLTSKTLSWLGSKFEAVVGNPPYVRHHSLSDQTIASAQRLLAAHESPLPRAASAWAYFAILAASCVRSGGRLALILPGAVLHSDYGRKVTSHITKSFASVQLLHVRERIFSGTDEESVVLLARGKGRSSVRATYARYDDTTSLIKNLDSIGDCEIDVELGHKSVLLSPEILETWRNVRKRPGFAPLGSVADVRIGVVTGANAFFVRQADDRLVCAAGVDSVPIISKNRYLGTPSMGKAELNKLRREGACDTLLLINTRGRKGSPLRREIDAAELEGLHERSHCKRRDPWYTITDRSISDYFLPYMVAEPPFLVKNAAHALCTNAIHRVYIRDKLVDWQAVQSSTHSELFAFEYELFGRSYGGSILKMEPTNATRLTIATNATAAGLSARERRILQSGRLALCDARKALRS